MRQKNSRFYGGSRKNMKRQVLKIYLNFFILGCLLVLFLWNMLGNINENQQEYPETTKYKSSKESSRGRTTGIDLCFHVQKREEDIKKIVSEPGKLALQDGTPHLCKECIKNVNKMLGVYSKEWKKNEENHQEIKSKLKNKCNGSHKAVITQDNTPIGSKLVFDGEKKRTLKVDPLHFSAFLKEKPFVNKTWKSCAVVGNGGILANSSCGNMIDSAEFVIRCNLPPLSHLYRKHVGVKTDLVTANPSIFILKYGSLMGRRRNFVENLCQYGDATLVLPAFSFLVNMGVCLRAFYTIEDFESPIRTAFFSPEYLDSLASFWRSKGLKEIRLSTGLMMTSLALELCDDVSLYGFWPFSVHPHSFETLANHYYDNKVPKKKIHDMPEEFKMLLQLHNNGTLRLHLGGCKSDGNSLQ